MDTGTLWVGSVLMPLGFIGTAAAAGGLYATAPGQCERVTGLEPGDCRNYFAFSMARIAYSGLMLISGAVMLGVGLHQRKQHREWKRMRNFSVVPLLPVARSGGTGLGVSLRF